MRGERSKFIPVIARSVQYLMRGSHQMEMNNDEAISRIIKSDGFTELKLNEACPECIEG